MRRKSTGSGRNQDRSLFGHDLLSFTGVEDRCLCTKGHQANGEILRSSAAMSERCCEAKRRSTLGWGKSEATIVGLGEWKGLRFRVDGGSMACDMERDARGR